MFSSCVSRRPAAGRALLVLALVSLVAGCATGASTGPSGPAPTGSILPVATGTPTAPPQQTEGPAIEPGFPVTVTDDDGTEVTIENQPARIVSLAPATTEILFALGAGDRVVGRTDADDYPAAVAAIPVVVTLGTVDVEQIVGLEPDLVIAGGGDFSSPMAVEALRDVDIPVIVTYAPTVEGVLEDIELVGQAIGSPVPATELADAMRTEMDAIAAALAASGRTPPRVFCELDAMKEIYGPADDSFLAEMISLAGGDPITTGSPTSWEMPLERLVVADPEVIVLTDTAYGVTPEQVAARPGWAGMTAVKAGAIRPIDVVVVTRPGPRLVDGLRALALAIDPAAPLPSTAP